MFYDIDTLIQVDVHPDYKYGIDRYRDTMAWASVNYDKLCVLFLLNHASCISLLVAGCHAGVCVCAYFLQWVNIIIRFGGLIHRIDVYMDLLPDTKNCWLCMRRECRERFPHHRFHRKQLVSDPGTHVPWCIGGSVPLLKPPQSSHCYLRAVDQAKKISPTPGHTASPVLSRLSGL